ncbi:hypothetical protein [Beggiatoa leptomitoformis]|uniref:DUF4398 domain-containing protein n=1 Tax=Beggiatoa leptomitoformis TaxID=288004 RepID=A0A2N9YBI5_9GAMM|nr:hypothetical protein [Beggiatoa leptomitoformis]ALG66826.1 hypothetical protein AL038_02735 [Beggiatoa leptomitoformis]AUI67821.1 hypothetical protein BLE401_03315 [Beggiatoa leptomitoformis]
MFKFISIVFLLYCLSACGISQAVYGVPEKQWETMSETERQITIERFNRQEAINAETRVQAEATRKAVEKARADAQAFEQQCLETHEKTAEECHVITRTRFERIF